MTDLMELFDDLERQTAPASRDEIVRAPFGYPGGKSRSVERILPELPYTNTYVEPFGGGGSILLARRASRLEVLNDRYSGVVSFYRCLRSNLDELVDRLDLALHSREDFVEAKATHDTCDSDIERAALWYIMIQHSFAALGRNWGRVTKGKGMMAAKVYKNLALFEPVHRRLRDVQIENQDWYQCMRDYDSPDTVFYLDPPYIDTNKGTYKYEMSTTEHRRLIDTIFSMEGFVAISGYSNPLYDNQDWDSVKRWEVMASMQGLAETNQAYTGVDRGKAVETLWIKEAG